MRRSEIHEAKCREWSKRIRDWSASGLTKVEWCSKNHVSVKCLQYWLKRIPETAQANCFPSQSADVPGNNNDFFELVPGATSGSKSASCVTDEPASTVSPELTIRCGRFSLDINSNVSRDTLTLVLAVLANA